MAQASSSAPSDLPTAGWPPRRGELDVSAVRRWLVASGVGVKGRLSATLIAGGRSNLTYRVTDEAGRVVVVRRPPLGVLLESAHDVTREARIVTALAVTPVPVPEILAVSDGPGVVGAPCYAMAFVPGRVLASPADGAGLAREARTRVSIQLVDTLAAVATVDPDAVGLGELSRRADYVPRQLRRWYRQFSSSDRLLPVIDDVHAKLAARVPPQRYTGLVHGDYRPGNVLVSPDGDIAAVLDWELCALGDTLADLGWMLATWHEPGTTAIYDSPTGHDGFLGRAALAERYATATGHDVSDLPFYVAFALWRLACIHEGIRVRYRSGAMADAIDADEQDRLVITLAEAAYDALTAC